MAPLTQTFFFLLIQSEKTEAAGTQSVDYVQDVFWY